MKFTTLAIRTLKPKSKRYEVFKDNGDGLAIRVFPSGVKSFIYFYKFETLSRRMTLGKFSDLSLAEANKKHSEARDKLKRGIDPGAEKVASTQKEFKAETVGQLAYEFMSRHVEKERKRPDHVKQILESNVLPYWRHRKAKNITRRDVVNLLDRITDRGALIMANRTAAIVTQMFKFGIQRGLLETTPCLYLAKPGGKEASRDRVLSEEEIKQIWDKLDDLPVTTGIILALRLLIVTGQRRGEIVNAEWLEIDLDKKLWAMPADKTKNGDAHVVPLSPIAFQLFKELKLLSCGSKWVIPSPVDLNKPITERAITRAVSRNMDLFGVEKWTPHDIRRSVTTGMRKLRIDSEIVMRVQNHRIGGIQGTYDRHHYLEEKKQALELWTRKVKRIIEGDGNAPNVVELAI